MNALQLKKSFTKPKYNNLILFLKDKNRKSLKDSYELTCRIHRQTQIVNFGNFLIIHFWLWNSITEDWMDLFLESDQKIANLNFHTSLNLSNPMLSFFLVQELRDTEEENTVFWSSHLTSALKELTVTALSLFGVYYLP